MKAFFSKPFIRNIFWLVVTASQAGYIFFYFSLVQPEVRKELSDHDYACIVSSNDISSWWINSSQERQFQVQVFASSPLLFAIQAGYRTLTFFNQLTLVFRHVVKVQRLLPAYIFHRVLII